MNAGGQTGIKKVGAPKTSKVSVVKAMSGAIADLRRLEYDAWTAIKGTKPTSLLQPKFLGYTDDGSRVTRYVIGAASLPLPLLKRFGLVDKGTVGIVVYRVGNSIRFTLPPIAWHRVKRSMRGVGGSMTAQLRFQSKVLRAAKALVARVQKNSPTSQQYGPTSKPRLVGLITTDAIRRTKGINLNLLVLGLREMGYAKMSFVSTLKSMALPIKATKFIEKQLRQGPVWTRWG